MAKNFTQAIKYKVKRFFLRRKGVVIHNNTVFGKVVFDGTALIEPYCRIIGDPLVRCGDNFYMNAGCHILGEIIIGKNVMIGPKTVIWGRDHLMEPGDPMCKQSYLKKTIRIGDDVWIAANVTILKGVTIGSGSVIGAGSVVVKDVPELAVVAGNPATIKKYRSTLPFK